MKKIRHLFLVMLLIFSLNLNAQDAKTISKKAEEAIQIQSMEMVSTLKIYNAKGDERLRTLTTATRKFGEVSKTLIRFIEPADIKGTTLLIFDYDNRDDDLWIFMPALRKTRRIVSSEKGKFFMGSEFTHADMTRPNIDDFTYRLLGEESIDGIVCRIIEALCISETLANEYGYSKRRAWIGKEDNLTRKVCYSDRDGVLLRTQLIKDYRKQPDNRYFAFFMEMKNNRNDRRSTLTINEFQSGSSLAEGSFSSSMLEN